MRSSDHHDLRAVLLALSRRLIAELARAGLRQWRCVRVLPRIDGSAEVALEGPRSNPIWDWLAPPLMAPYLTGVYLVANALRDAYLVVDGPSCVFFRTAQIQPNHDRLAELTRVVPRLEWVLAQELLDRQVAIAADAVLSEALATALPELGCQVVLQATLTAHRRADQQPLGDEAIHGARQRGETLQLIGPTRSELRNALLDRLTHDELELGVVSSLVVDVLNITERRVGFVEVGFPSYYTHALHPMPMLGFAGTECLMSRLVNALRAAAI